MREDEHYNEIHRRARIHHEKRPLPEGGKEFFRGAIVAVQGAPRGGEKKSVPGIGIKVQGGGNKVERQGLRLDNIRSRKKGVFGAEPGIDASEKYGNGGKNLPQKPDGPEDSPVPVGHPRCHQDIVRRLLISEPVEKFFFIEAEMMVSARYILKRPGFLNFSLTYFVSPP